MRGNVAVHLEDDLHVAPQDDAPRIAKAPPPVDKNRDAPREGKE